MSATCYLDIGAIRIQSWLARTDMLRLRRGASIMLDQATNPVSVLGWLGAPIDLTASEDAAPVSGVLHLKVTGDDETGAVRAAADYAEKIVVGLRTKVPGVTWTASWTIAESYREATALAAAGRSDGSLRGLAALADIPFARLCDTCAAATAVDVIDLPGSERARVCDDCRARSEAAGNAGDQLPKTSLGLLERLRGDRALPEGGRGLPKQAEDLAKLRGDTQTALIFADGNRIGDYMAEQANAGTARAGGEAVTEATWAAIVSAVKAITDDEDATWPIIPHLVGGDDVLVSVPAAEGWTFARELLAAFGKNLQGQSMSLGLVFSHASHPFLVQVERAEERLHAAKQEGRGAAAVAWVDLTSDDPGSQKRRGAELTLGKIEEIAPDLTAFSSWPRSARRAIVNLEPDGEAAAIEHAGRTDSDREPVVKRLWDEIGLDAAMRISRWWR